DSKSSKSSESFEDPFKVLEVLSERSGFLTKDRDYSSKDCRTKVAEYPKDPKNVRSLESSGDLKNLKNPANSKTANNHHNLGPSGRRNLLSSKSQTTDINT
ncbi:hypothetical protein K0M31_005406, partial [Melipona bicolor]